MFTFSSVDRIPRNGAGKPLRRAGRILTRAPDNSAQATERHATSERNDTRIATA
jgi:hypothetical protein